MLTGLVHGLFKIQNKKSMFENASILSAFIQVQEYQNQ